MEGGEGPVQKFVRLPGIYTEYKAEIGKEEKNARNSE